MPMIVYTEKRFNAQHALIIERANTIIEEYAAQGYDLTLRQLYYQFVSRDWFPEEWAGPQTGSTNNVRSYKKLGTIISDGRRAGLIDWERIVDRTRNVRRPSAWGGPAEIVAACADQFNVDMWAGQRWRPEVWVEKDALIGVLEVACEPWRVPYFSCRGYTSDSEAWGAARRLRDHVKSRQKPIVFHLGDHDPSGIDMTRDIRDRIALFAGLRGRDAIEVRRIALNMDQVEEYEPPPNPAKETDSRYAGYRDEFGDESWELDALEPTTIGELIASEMRALINPTAWAEAERRRDAGRETLRRIATELQED